MYNGKMLRSRRNFARCRGHGQTCGIVDEIRPAFKREQDKIEWRKAMNDDHEALDDYELIADTTENWENGKLGRDERYVECVNLSDDYNPVIHGAGSGISTDESISTREGISDDYDPVIEGGGEGISGEWV